MEETTHEDAEPWEELLADTRLSLTESPFLGDLLTELATAQLSQAHLNSLHEAYAVILAEVEALWEDVRRTRDERCHDEVRKALLQIAAMAWRAALNCGYDSPHEP